jgi:mercuric ion transport protein
MAMPKQMRNSHHLRIEMVYDPDCPNVDRARAAIRGALEAIGAPVAWREWDRNDPSTPAALAVLGSPSVLVNGRDVGCDGGSMAQADANSCRIYQDDCGCICGAPSIELILRTIAENRGSEEIA